MPGSRWFAAFYDLLSGSAELALAPRREFAAGGAKGQVLEIGAGTGGNIPFYKFAAADGASQHGALPAGEGVTELTLTDVSAHMLKRLRAKLRKQAVEATLVQTGAESLPFLDCSFDTVVGTLVLCSVRGQARALAEVHRVLRPVGQFRFFEHVRAGNRGWAALQSGLRPFWCIVADGCEPERDPLAAIRRAGFALAEFESYGFGPYPVRPHVMGVATRQHCR